MPTARHGAFDDAGPALDFLRSMPPPYVVKTDGLAAGKGVFVTESLIDAEDDVKAKLAGASFGDAGRVVVIEEGLTGPELSVLAVCDGSRAVPLAPAQDFKRVGRRRPGSEHGRHGLVLAGARWPATISSAGSWTSSSSRPCTSAQARHRLPRDAVRGTDDDARRPEAARVQRPIRRSGGAGRAAAADVRPVRAARVRGRRRSWSTTRRRSWTTRPCASSWRRPGYPEAPRTGAVIDGLDESRAGGRRRGLLRRRRRDSDGRLITAGGRVLDVVGFGPTIAAARIRAYAGVRPISFPGMHVPQRHRRCGGEGGAVTSEGGGVDGLTERPGQDAARSRHARAVRHRSRRPRAVRAPQSRRGRRVRLRRARERLRRDHLRRGHGGASRRRCRRPHDLAGRRRPAVAAVRSTASTRSTRRCRCRRASRSRPSPSTAR